MSALSPAPVWVGYARKALVAVVAFIGQVVSLGLLNGTWQAVAVAAIAALAAVGVYATPNIGTPNTVAPRKGTRDNSPGL